MNIRVTTPTWPPDYRAVFSWRQKQLMWLRQEPEARFYGAREYYRTRPHEFIEHWGITVNPKNVGTELPTHMPFILFPRQRELLQFLWECFCDRQPGLVEKAREMGATWLACAFSVWLWLFHPGTAIGWGSRKQNLVDELGVMDSIFEKMRVFIRWLPEEFLPVGFNPAQHMPSMRIINPENGAVIAGEIGDNIGRGGRKRIFLKDESAHYEHPEAVEAALMSNTDVPIDISSVSGPNNVFHRKREAGQEWSPGTQIEPGRTRVFVMDWRDHPTKTEEWYNREKQRKLDEGLGHLWAQEVDRNYAASVIGTIIPAEWIRAALDAHVKLGFDESGGWCGALDVADGGQDTNAFSLRKGVVLKHIEEWAAPDAAVTARRAVNACAGRGALELQYDCIGIGASVKSEGNRLTAESLMPAGVRLVPWNAGEQPLFADKPIIARDKDSPLNGDFYGNLKAQGWWQLRLRFERTWRAITYGEIKALRDLARENAATPEQTRRLTELCRTVAGSLEDDPARYTYDPDTLISIATAAIPVAVLRKLEKELSQATVTQSSRLKLIVNKTPEGTKSPNLADSVMMNYWPVPVKKPMMISAAVLDRALLPG